MRFDQYLNLLADHEWQKAEEWTTDNPRQRIMIAAGVALNWLGDYLGNPDISWQEQIVSVDCLRFTGTGPAWNKVLLDQCQRLPSKLRQIADTAEIQQLFADVTVVPEKPILVRAGEADNEYKVLDGMPNVIRAVLDGIDQLSVMVPVNELEVLPECEAHVVYDLIRGCDRHAKDEAGLADLHHALVLLCRTYANVPDLLRDRFDPQRIGDDQITAVIGGVLSEID